MLYRLLSGSLPYGSGLPAIPKIDKADLPTKPDKSYHKLVQFSWLVDELWGIIKTCLQKKPSKRPDADSLVQKFESLCYGIFPRQEGSIKNYRDGTGDWGFIYSSEGDVFFHRQSFYGDLDVIKTGQKVQFSKHKGGGADRAYPVIPLIQE